MVVFPSDCPTSQRRPWKTETVGSARPNRSLSGAVPAPRPLAATSLNLINALAFAIVASNLYAGPASATVLVRRQPWLTLSWTRMHLVGLTLSRAPTPSGGRDSGRWKVTLLLTKAVPRSTLATHAATRSLHRANGGNTADARAHPPVSQSSRSERTMFPYVVQ
jgi:hypothetical protein